MGVIGTAVAKAASGDIPGVTLAGVTWRDPPRRPAILRLSARRARGALRPDRRGGHPGGAPRVRPHRPRRRQAPDGPLGGALVGVALDEWARLAEKHGCRILVPSGAIAGLDGVKGARRGHPSPASPWRRASRRAGLTRAPYIEERRIDLDAISEETLIFEGPRRRRR